jgi:hypothetical protein
VAKDKHKNKKSENEGNIKNFLTQLGIRRGQKEFDEIYWREISDAGVDFGNIKSSFGSFSQQANDVYFLNESIARKTLSVDYQRIYDAIHSFKKLNGFPASPQNVCELGGGAGVIAMWLAKRWPECSITVVDQSQHALEIGEKWSKNLGLNNLTFKRDTYQETASSLISHKNDFVFAINAIDFKEINFGDQFFRSLKEINFSDKLESRTKPIEEFVKACKNTITHNGLLYVNPGNAGELDLLALFEYLRRHNFGIDWEYTIVSDIEKCQGSCCESRGNVHLFLRPNFPSLLTNSWEDLRAISLMAQWLGKNISLSDRDFETYFDLLSDGTKLYSVTVRLSNNIVDSSYVYLKAGMMGFFRVSQNFNRRGMIHSAAAVFEIINQIRHSINSGQVTVIDEYIDSNFVKIEDCKKTLQ